MPVGQRLNLLLDLVMERQTREPTPPFARPARCGGSDNTLNSSRGRLLQRNGAWTPSSMGAAPLVTTTVTWQMLRHMAPSHLLVGATGKGPDIMH